MPATLAPRPAAGTDTPFYLTAGRLVPYKNVLAIVEAFKAMPGKRLVVAGSGPELARLKAVGAPNVEFVGFVPDDKLRDLMRGAEAFLFAAEEDFGILPVEAQSEGTAVIALGRGGVRETIVTDGAAPDRDILRHAQRGVDRRGRRGLRPAAPAASRGKRASRMRAGSAQARFEREFSGFVDRCYKAFQAELRATSSASAEQPTWPLPLPAPVRTGSTVEMVHS